MSHITTEAEVVSWDTGLGVEGFLALKLLDIVSDVLEPPVSRTRGDPSRQLKRKTFKAIRNPLMTFHQTHISPVIVLMCESLRTLKLG